MADKIRLLTVLIVSCAFLNGCATYTIYEKKSAEPSEAVKTELKVRGPKVAVNHTF